MPLDYVSAQVESAKDERMAACVPACPVCGGYLLEVRAKLQCTRCHAVCETCCDGVPAQG